MIERLLVRRRESAATNWVYNAKLARLMSGTPQSSSADLLAVRARRRLRFWDALLDLWTYRDRKSGGADNV